MNPPKFEYYRAGSVDEALTLLGDHPGAKFLAGGHSLLPIMKLRLANPETLIDIGRIDGLRGIRRQEDGGFTIGALTTHAEVAANQELPRVLSEAAGQIGDPQVRNRGTVGGNVAHADPASDLPTVFLALDASFNIAGPDGERSVSAKDFFQDMFMTALGMNEILTSIDVPPIATNGASGSAYTKMKNPASRYAMIGAAAVLTMVDGRCEAARVAVGSLTPSPVHARSVEAALQGQDLGEENIAAAAQKVQDDLGDDLIGDIHASTDYRRSVVPVFVKRAMLRAAERAAN